MTRYRCETCPAFKVCAGRAKAVPPGGWLQVSDLISKGSQMDRRSFDVSWFNAIPGLDPEQLVYGGSWDDSRNIVEDHDIPQGARVVMGGDFGQRNLSSILWGYEDPKGVLVIADMIEVSNRPSALLADDIFAREENTWFPWALVNHGGKRLRIMDEYHHPPGHYVLRGPGSGGLQEQPVRQGYQHHARQECRFTGH